MNVKKLGAVGVVLAAAMMAAVPAAAVGRNDDPVVAGAPHGVPVYPGDITDRPYKVVGEIETGVRKATIFSKSSSEGKIYRELWERAEKMGADAVINAKYGKAKVSLDSWGKTKASGTAIKFVDAAYAQASEAEPAPAD